MNQPQQQQQAEQEIDINALFQRNAGQKLTEDLIEVMLGKVVKFAQQVGQLSYQNGIEEGKRLAAQAAASPVAPSPEAAAALADITDVRPVPAAAAQAAAPANDPGALPPGTPLA